MPETNINDLPHFAEAAKALENGPRGALVLAGLGAAAMLVSWLAFYVLIFMARGAID